MKSSVIILVLLVAAAMGLSTARSDLDLLRAIQTNIEGEDNYEKKACCNDCGICNRCAPECARCRCNDLVLHCHPTCRNCVQSPLRIYPPLYQCLDMSYKACHRNCNDATTTFKSVN